MTPTTGTWGARARAVHYEFGTPSRRLVDHADGPCGRPWPTEIRTPCCWSSDCRSVDTRAYPGAVRGHSPSLSDPTGAQSSHSSTMPVTLCEAMYFSAVMKVPSSRGSCTSRSYPHFSHASGIHWRGSEVVVMSASSQPRRGLPIWPYRSDYLEQGCISLKGSSSCWAVTASMPHLRVIVENRA